MVNTASASNHEQLASRQLAQDDRRVARHSFDHVDSFLMDRATLNAHASVWGVEDKPLRADLHRLTPEECALYDELRDNRIREGLRLEQEHVGFHWLRNRLQELLGETAGNHPRALPIQPVT